MLQEFRIVTSRDSFYLRSAHLLAAAAFKRDDEVQHAACEHVQAYVIGAILCAVSFLEVSINGLFEGESRQSSRRTKLLAALQNVWSEGFDRQPTLAKYQIALALAHAKLFDAATEPYQSVNALILLRNTIAHPKRIISDDAEQQKLQALLRGKYSFKKIDPRHEEFFPKSCLSPACAAWALLSAAKFVKEFEQRLPPSARSIVPFLDAYITTAKRLLEHGIGKRTTRLFGDAKPT